MSDPVREAFEAYMRERNVCTRLQRQSEAVGGEYRTSTVERAWQIWQADARAALAAPVADVRAEFEVWQDDMPVATAAGPREQALAEARHYAMVYGQDGPVEVVEVTRRLIDIRALKPEAVKAP